MSRLYGLSTFKVCVSVYVCVCSVCVHACVLYVCVHVDVVNVIIYGSHDALMFGLLTGCPARGRGSITEQVPFTSVTYFGRRLVCALV